MPLVYLAAAAATVLIVSRSGIYPAGVDTLCHIYKGDVLYRSILQGDWWPIFDPMWYNGVEMLRYWAPLPVYIFAGCQAVAGGDPMNGYLIFVGVLYYFYALIWLYVGYKMERPVLGAFFGAIWFYMPNNLVAMFEEGNLPRTICVGILPLLVYFIHEYARDRNWRALPKITVCFAFVSLCHSGYAGMILISFLILAVLHKMIVRKKDVFFPVAAALLLGYLLIGVWLVPSLIGGITSTDSTEIMAGFFQSLRVSIDPLYRLHGGLYDFYFGAAACVIAVFGCLCAPRGAIPGFLAALVILLCTTTTLYPILSKLPGGQYLWMLRFISIGLCFILFSLLLWKGLRTPILLLLCALLVADIVPSLPLMYGNRTGESAYDMMAKYQDWTLIGEAQQITKQRLALVDESTLDSLSAYLVTGYGDPVATTYGAAWQSCTIATNFKQVDLSLETGDYFYLFDRCMELGNDTVLVLTSLVRDIVRDPVEKMDAAAAARGYSLVDENGRYRLYHMDTPDAWGTVTDYRSIAIGTHSAGTSLSFPAIEETTSNHLEDYTFEELSRYEMVYITDFTYDDRAYAEDLILRLSESGTRVVMVADGIPQDRVTHYREFLGLICNDIQFSNGYPEMDTIDGRLFTDMFPQGYTEWRTVYVEGLDEVWGQLYDNGLMLDFYGTVKNDNIVVVALNLPYFHELTHDPSAEHLLSHAMKLPANRLPERRVVPLEVTIDGGHIMVDSPEDGVNTSLAWHESFASDAPVYTRNNLTFVGAGTTHLTVTYPYLGAGAAVSIAALIGTIVLAVVDSKREKWERAKKQAETEAKEASSCAAGS